MAEWVGPDPHTTIRPLLRLAQIRLKVISIYPGLRVEVRPVPHMIVCICCNLYCSPAKNFFGGTYSPVFGRRYHCPPLSSLLIVTKLSDKNKSNIIFLIVVRHCENCADFDDKYQLYFSKQKHIVIPHVYCCSIIKESPRWLVVNGKHERAMKVLEHICAVNGSTLPADFHVKHIEIVNYSIHMLISINSDDIIYMRIIGYV